MREVACKGNQGGAVTSLSSNHTKEAKVKLYAIGQTLLSYQKVQGSICPLLTGIFDLKVQHF